MKEKLDNYFLGKLSNEEKNTLFDEIESDEEYKSEFIRTQNTITISKLFTQKGDDVFAHQMIKELDKRVSWKQKRRTFNNVMKYAAVVILLITNGWLLIDKIDFQLRETTYTRIEVPKGQRVSMTLTDGTEVWLSPRSVLLIPDQFDKNKRLVKLDGEGYFSVKKSGKRPFIIETGQHDIKVLGTRFNVFAYTESSRFETDLLEGKIEVLDRNNNRIRLEPGEKVSLQNRQLIKSISRFSNEEYLKNGIFSFNNKPFSEILEYLTLWYDIRFDIKDSAKKELLVSGKFRQSDDLRSILKALQGVHSFRFKEINDGIIEIY